MTDGKFVSPNFSGVKANNKQSIPASSGKTSLLFSNKEVILQNGKSKEMQM